MSQHKLLQTKNCSGPVKRLAHNILQRTQVVAVQPETPRTYPLSSLHPNSNVIYF